MQYTSPAEADEGTIENSAFFPDVALAKAREIANINGTITKARLHEALVTAILKTNSNLTEWVNEQKTAGITAMSEMEGLAIGDINQHEHYYIRAVACYAKASITERNRDFDSTAEGHDRADDMQTTIDDYWRDYQWALSDLQDKSRAQIELI